MASSGFGDTARAVSHMSESAAPPARHASVLAIFPAARHLDSRSSASHAHAHDIHPGRFELLTTSARAADKDHHESLLAYVHWYAKKTEATKAELVACDADGMTLLLVNESERVHIPWPKECEVSSSKDLRKATVFMHIEAFNNLGIAYRLRTGYYTQIARMGAFLVYKKTRSYDHVAIPAAAIAVGALVYYKRLAKR